MLSITTNIDSQKKKNKKNKNNNNNNNNNKQQTSNISIFSKTCKTHYSLPLV